MRLKLLRTGGWLYTPHHTHTKSLHLTLHSFPVLVFITTFYARIICWQSLILLNTGGWRERCPNRISPNGRRRRRVRERVFVCSDGHMHTQLPHTHHTQLRWAREHRYNYRHTCSHKATQNTNTHKPTVTHMHNLSLSLSRSLFPRCVLGPAGHRPRGLPCWHSQSSRQAVSSMFISFSSLPSLCAPLFFFQNLSLPFVSFVRFTRMNTTPVYHLRKFRNQKPLVLTGP